MPFPARRNRPFTSVALRLLVACATLALASTQACAALFDDVGARAQQLAARPFVPEAKPAAPAASDALTYDQYRDIRFRPDHSLWRDQKLPFEVQFFHPGFVNTETVKIHEVSADGKARELPLATAYFDYGHNKPPSTPPTGFSGFRIHYPINNAAHKDEVIVFQGASYFRAIGKDQRYGLSARGLAVDTVGAGAEEFPRFTEFWLEKPAADATSLVITALLDSKSLTGAYRFVVTPGKDTVVDVQSRLYLRKDVRTLGIAALTSMFFSGENQPQPGDFRPEVHDSDGLMVQSGSGEWLWRPLSNPKRILTTSFAMPQSVKGFGLMQRDRSYASYEDDEARYELRPSAWITPVGDWGPGRVELVQLNTVDETNDNIVAYWVPAKLPALGQPLDLSYRLQWQGSEQAHPPGAWVTQSRSGRSFATLGKGEEQVIVDFTGPSLAALPADAEVKAVVTGVANVDVVSTNAYRNEANGTWRLAIRFKQRNADEPVELRAFLQHGNDILSETWTHVIPPR